MFPFPLIKVCTSQVAKSRESFRSFQNGFGFFPFRRLSHPQPESISQSVIKVISVGIQSQVDKLASRSLFRAQSVMSRPSARPHYDHLKCHKMGSHISHWHIRSCMLPVSHRHTSTLHQCHEYWHDQPAVLPHSNHDTIKMPLPPPL